MEETIDVKQLLIAPKGTMFMWMQGNEKAHIVEYRGGPAFCGTAVILTQLSMSSAYEDEVCSECLAASAELDWQPKKG